MIRLQKFKINNRKFLIYRIDAYDQRNFTFHTFGISLDKSVVINYPLCVERTSY